MNLFNEPNGYVYNLDAKGVIERLDATGLSRRMKPYYEKDTALAWLRPAVVPFDHEAGRFEFLFRERPLVNTRSDGRVRCRQQMARAMALMALRKYPGVVYVTVDYTTYVLTLLHDTMPTGISGSVAAAEIDIKALQMGISGLLGQALVQQNLADPGRKVAAAAAPMESPGMDL
jgi:hypothetical protein